MGYRVDSGELGTALVRVIAEAYMPLVKTDTPMSEVREIHREMGERMGRVLAAIEHEGDVDGDYLMYIRLRERENIEKALHSSRLFGPGQMFREILERRGNEVWDDLDK